MTKAQIAEQIAMLTKMMEDAPDTTQEDRWSGLIHKFNTSIELHTLAFLRIRWVCVKKSGKDMILFARNYAEMMGYTKPKPKPKKAVKSKVIKDKQHRKKAVNRIPTELYQRIYFKDGETFTQTFTEGRTIRYFKNQYDSTVDAIYRQDTNDFKCTIAFNEFTCKTLGDAMKRNWENATGKTIDELNEALKKQNIDKNGHLDIKTLRRGLPVSLYTDGVGFTDEDGSSVGLRDLFECDFEGFGDTKGREWDNNNIHNIQNKTWTIEKFTFNKSTCLRNEPNKLMIEPKKLTIKKNKK